MYAGFSYAGGVFAGTNLFVFVRSRRGGIGGSGFPDIFPQLLPTEVDRRRRRRREEVLAMREDEDALMNV